MNRDELGSRVRCPAGEDVMASIGVADLYKASSENRKSVTIYEIIHADGREPFHHLLYARGSRSWTLGFMIDWPEMKPMLLLLPAIQMKKPLWTTWIMYSILHTMACATKPWKFDGRVPIPTICYMPRNQKPWIHGFMIDELETNALVSLLQAIPMTKLFLIYILNLRVRFRPLWVMNDCSISLHTPLTPPLVYSCSFRPRTPYVVSWPLPSVWSM